MNSNKKREMQLALAWNLRCLRSGFGKQTLNYQRTEPKAAFGSSNKEVFRKQYLSADLARASVGDNSQGPVYKTYGGFGAQCNSVRPSSARAVIGTAPLNQQARPLTAVGPGGYKHEHSLGKQLTSRRATSARAAFGAQTRDDRDKMYMDPELDKVNCGRGTPGPVYRHLVGIGRQPLSTAPTAARAHFGSASRFKGGPSHPIFSTPGAGQYETHAGGLTAVGKQVFSKRRTLPAYGFGTSTRDGMKHVFISTEHEKCSHGEGTPGPMLARPRSAFQKQVNSSKATAPRPCFGNSKRTGICGNSTVPGPGTYCA